MSFDLVERPWIMVHRRGDGRVEEVSIRELFARAGEFRTILGEVPTQSFALVRLLLAILHRAVEGPVDSADWHELWRGADLPMADIDGYLDDYRGRLDLLSPEQPFYQVAGLSPEKPQVFGLTKLIADVPAGAPYFTTRLKVGVERVSFAEAARWVVHCQAFDPSGIKTGAVGDRRVKNGKGYPIGVGWAGNLGGVLVEGRDLRETLLLNLVPYSSGGLLRDERDVPVWERDPLGAGQEEAPGRPYGPLDLYTWQSRRLRLVHDGSVVTGAMISNGDRLAPQNRFRLEPMSAWRRSRAQEKKLGEVPVYMPREHQPERAFWRGLGSLLPSVTAEGAGREAADALPPAVLKWLAEAHGLGLLPAHYTLRTRAVGMTYGSQQAVIDDIVDDQVALPVVLLAEGDRELGTTAVDAVGEAEAAARLLGHLAGNLALAAGGDAPGPRARAEESAYAALDRPFRSWLVSLGPQTDPGEARAGWQGLVRDLIGDLGEELVLQAGPVAWRGRVVGEWHVSTPQADRRFHSQLRRLLPLAYTPHKHQEHDEHEEHEEKAEVAA